MLDSLEFMVAFLRLLTWLLLFLLIFWVLPAMTLQVAEEFGKEPPPVPERYQGRHWRDPQDYEKKMYVISFVNRRREERGGIRGHRRTV